MSQRIIVITGASGGIAEEMIKRLPSEDGLVLLGRSQDKLEEMYRHVSNKTCIGLDITDNEALESVVDQIYLQYGRIDIFVNNAGFGEFKSYNNYDFDSIEEMFDVNTLATIHFSRLVGKRMAEEGHGHIINIASMAGLIASAKSTIYSATKFAVIGFSNALRLELAEHHVYVTTVNPGPIDTTFFDRADPTGEYLKSIERFSLKPEVVAKRIIKIMGKNKRELNMPFALAMAHKCYTLFPKISDFLARKVFNFK